MNAAAKKMNQALEEREFAKSTQLSYRYLYDELFDIYVENSKSIISHGTPEEARSAMDTCTPHSKLACDSFPHSWPS